jgi:hypothetical protein
VHGSIHLISRAKRKRSEIPVIATAADMPEKTKAHAICGVPVVMIDRHLKDVVRQEMQDQGEDHQSRPVDCCSDTFLRTTQPDVILLELHAVLIVHPILTVAQIMLAYAVSLGSVGRKFKMLREVGAIATVSKSCLE